MLDDPIRLTPERAAWRDALMAQYDIPESLRLSIDRIVLASRCQETAERVTRIFLTRQDRRRSEYR
jgi:hypothetical protein